MSFDFASLAALQQHHPAWRLLRSDHAPLIASFLHRVFVAPNVRVMAATDLAAALDDQLYALRQQLGDDAYPRTAADYLSDWAAPDKGWLRKFYQPGTDEAQFDLTPSTEKAIAWLEQLSARQFVGTESRLLILFELLKQMSEGSESDPATRIAELERKRQAIDAEIARIRGGDIPLLDDTALRDRFQQFSRGARELLADFREVEANFRQLDRHMREQITQWGGGKGALLERIMGERDAIDDSDQGRSFRAFWEFLLSSRRQEELTQLLEQVLTLPAIAATQPDPRVRRVHYDWLAAGEHTQRTVAALSQQLRRFLDDQAWLENRRIMDILHSIEGHALALRQTPPAGSIMEIDAMRADIDLAMERPLFTPASKPAFASLVEAGDEFVDPSALFDQRVVDKARLTRHVRRALHGKAQVTLHELVATLPLQQGLAELITYLELGDEVFSIAIDDATPEPIVWRGCTADGQPVRRSARVPRIIFSHPLPTAAQPQAQ